MNGFAGMGYMTPYERAALSNSMSRIYRPSNAFLLEGLGSSGIPEPSPIPTSSPGAGMKWQWDAEIEAWDTVPMTAADKALYAEIGAKAAQMQAEEEARIAQAEKFEPITSLTPRPAMASDAKKKKFMQILGAVAVIGVIGLIASRH